MIGLLEPRDADRSGGRICFEMIEIEAQIVDRHLGGLIGFVRNGELRGGRSRNRPGFNAGDSAVGGSAKFISSDSTVGSSRGGISRVGESSAPRSGAVQGEVEIRRGVQSLAISPVAAVSSLSLAMG